MSKDPIVEEVRAIRDEIAKEHGYDLDSIFKDLQKRDSSRPGNHVSLAARPYSAPVKS
jgi:hypothetical protein